MSNDALIAIIGTLIGAHYISMVYEIRKLRESVALLAKEINATALAAAVAAAVATAVAAKKA